MQILTSLYQGYWPKTAENRNTATTMILFPDELLVVVRKRCYCRCRMESNGCVRLSNRVYREVFIARKSLFRRVYCPWALFVRPNEMLLVPSNVVVKLSIAVHCGHQAVSRNTAGKALKASWMHRNIAIGDRHAHSFDGTSTPAFTITAALSCFPTLITAPLSARLMMPLCSDSVLPVDRTSTSHNRSVPSGAGLK